MSKNSINDIVPFPPAENIVHILERKGFTCVCSIHYDSIDQYNTHHAEFYIGVCIISYIWAHHGDRLKLIRPLIQIRIRTS